MQLPYCGLLTWKLLYTQSFPKFSKVLGASSANIEVINFGNLCEKMISLSGSDLITKVRDLLLQLDAKYEIVTVVLQYLLLLWGIPNLARCSRYMIFIIYPVDHLPEICCKTGTVIYSILSQKLYNKRVEIAFILVSFGWKNNRKFI